MAPETGPQHFARCHKRAARAAAGQPVADTVTVADADRVGLRPHGPSPTRGERGRWSVLKRALATVLCLAAACASGATGPDIGRLPIITTGDPQAEADLGKARAARDEGNRALAEAQYRTFIKRHGHDPLAPIAKLELGKMLLDAGEDAEAGPLFTEVSRHQEPAVAEQARFYGAVAAQRAGHSEEAAATLRPMVGRTIDPADTSLLLATLADAELALARLESAVIALDRLATDGASEADRRGAQAKLDQLIAQRATAEEIDSLMRSLREDGPAYGLVMRRAVRDAQAAHDSERTRDLIERMRSAGLSLDDSLEEIALRASQPGDADPHAVGAILSLTGPARQVGERALRGLMLAANLPPQGPPGAETARLIFRDDGGDPARAAQAVDELVGVHRVIAIVGPMESDSARAAAARAEAVGVPLIALSPAADLVEIGKLIFQVMPTARAEVTALVDQAVAEGRRRFAMLRPEGGYGDTMQAVYEMAVRDRGASLVSVQTYPGDATAFGQQIAALARTRPDTIFVADAAPRLALIAPALAAAGLWSGGPDSPPPSDGRIIQLLAPAVAFHHATAEKSARYLQGALFAVPFDPITAEGPARAFTERFEAQFGSQPDAFAALAYDAYTLVEAAARRTGGSRASVGETLRVLRSDKLAGPARGFARDGSLDVPTRLLRFGPEGFLRAR